MVTIGIPVYNEGKYIRATLESVIKNLPDIEKVIIADNASSDDTPNICKEFASKYPKINYIRHKTNIGSWNNWNYVKDKGESKYFMFLGGHDILPEHYISILVAQLEKDDNAILAYGRTEYIDETGRSISLSDYKYSDDLYGDNPFERIYSFTKNLWYIEAYFHGVFRYKSLMDSFINIPCIGIDFAFLCKALSIGKFIYSSDTKFLWRRHRKETSKQAFERWVQILDSRPMPLPDKPYKKMQELCVEVIKDIPAEDKERDYWTSKIKNELRRFGDFESGLDALTFARRQVNRINSIISLIGDTESVVICGEKFHNEKLMQHTTLPQKKIEYFIDNNSGGYRQNGYEVKYLNDIDDIEADVIIVNSVREQRNILDLLSKKVNDKVRIIRLYDDDDVVPFFYPEVLMCLE